QSARATQSQWAPALAAKQLKFANPAHADYLAKLITTPVKAALPGQIIYEMACLPCHQPEGKGLPGVYPPLTGSDWLTGDKSRLIKIVLHGLDGPITVAGQPFVMQNPVPMPAFGGLDDQQIADVLSYIRAEYGKGAAPVSKLEVQALRDATKSRQMPWTAAELLR
ncbi:MAG: cytochrome c, partial [Pedosphaera sp.]|nr:cytochrome c [Pedosphaera sp.]